MKSRILHIIAIILIMLTLFSTYSSAFNVQYEDPLTTDVAGNDIGNQVQQWGEEGKGDTTSNSGTTNSHELSMIDVVGDTRPRKFHNTRLITWKIQFISYKFI